MFLRCSHRKKNGKEHSYWSSAENRRLADGRVAQRHVLYLGEINDARERAWARSIFVFRDGNPQLQTMAVFPEDRVATTVDDASIMRLRLPIFTQGTQMMGLHYHTCAGWGKMGRVSHG